MILDRKEREFLSTLSLRRATGTLPSHRPRVQHFYPRSPCGERQCTRLHPSPADTHFYPRSPCGERRYNNNNYVVTRGFLSTLSLRRATAGDALADLRKWISIHALLAESDTRKIRIFDNIFYFYPRSPCGERRFLAKPASTLQKHFYPRSPCGERQQRHRNKLSRNHNFYPRSPCGERQHPFCAPPINMNNFYPRSPCGERPVTARIIDPTFDFYPRSPCGERQYWVGGYGTANNFYPRSPCGERRCRKTGSTAVTNFYPRSPCGERLTPARILSRLLLISIHALLAESDGKTV